MRVKLCAPCRNTPRDLADYYDSKTILHACDREQGMLNRYAPFNMYYPREAHRRRKCSTAPNAFGTAERRAAPSVTESLVWSGTTPGELPSVQRSARIA
jgi:hypothetical protein